MDKVFTIEAALKIQAETLNNLKQRLNSECYSALLMFALNSNIGKTDPYTICRGSDLTNFVSNWSPLHKIGDVVTAKGRKNGQGLFQAVLIGYTSYGWFSCTDIKTNEVFEIYTTGILVNHGKYEEFYENSSI